MEGKSNASTEITFKLGFFNLDGFWKAMRSGEFLNTILEFDSLCVVETWIKNGDNINITGYKFSRKATRNKNKKGRQSGGIGFRIKENYLNHCETKDFGTGESLWLIKKKSKVPFNMIIRVIYQPPLISNFYDTNLYKNLEHEINYLLEKFPGYEIC